MKIEKSKELKKGISDFIINTLNTLENEGKTDYFNIEISNHNGNLKMNYEVKEIKKVY